MHLRCNEAPKPNWPHPISLMHHTHISYRCSYTIAYAPVSDEAPGLRLSGAFSLPSNSSLARLPREASPALPFCQLRMLSSPAQTRPGLLPINVQLDHMTARDGSPELQGKGVCTGVLARDMLTDGAAQVSKLR